MTKIELSNKKKKLANDLVEAVREDKYDKYRNTPVFEGFKNYLKELWVMSSKNSGGVTKYYNESDMRYNSLNILKDVRVNLHNSIVNNEEIDPYHYVYYSTIELQTLVSCLLSIYGYKKLSNDDEESINRYKKCCDTVITLIEELEEL